MTNFEKYADTPEKLTLLIIHIMDGDRNNEIESQYCLGDCASCTDEELKQCVLIWLMKEAT